MDILKLTASKAISKRVVDKLDDKNLKVKTELDATMNDFLENVDGATKYVEELMKKENIPLDRTYVSKNFIQRVLMIFIHTYFLNRLKKPSNTYQIFSTVLSTRFQMYVNLSMVL